MQAAMAEAIQVGASFGKPLAGRRWITEEDEEDPG